MIYKGKYYKTRKALCEELGVNQHTVRNRILELGMTLEEAVETPIHTHKFTHEGVTYASKKAYLKSIGVPYGRYFGRIKHGKTHEEAIK